jgi:hypothetical protein
MASGSSRFFIGDGYNSLEQKGERSLIAAPSSPDFHSTETWTTAFAIPKCARRMRLMVEGWAHRRPQP